MIRVVRLTAQNGRVKVMRVYFDSVPQSARTIIEEQARKGNPIVATDIMDMDEAEYAKASEEDLLEVDYHSKR